MAEPYWRDEKYGLEIYHGDCISVMPELEGKFELCLTDFDYCIDTDTVITRPEADGGTEYATGEFFGSALVGEYEQQRAFCEQCLALIGELLCEGSVICAFHANDKLGMVWDWARQAEWIAVQPYVWVKTNPMPQVRKVKWANGIEQAAIVAKPGPRHYDHTHGHRPNYVITRVGRRTEHPTEKPLGVFEPIVKWWSQQGEAVLDPFLGSGTTLVVCYQLGRGGVGIEINEEYCEGAARRLEREIAQGRFWEADELEQKPKQELLKLG